MKNIINGIIALAVIFGMALGSGYIDTHYTREGEVVEIINNETAVIEDTTGEQWVWNIEKPLEIGQMVKMTMNNNCTEKYLYDDIIENVR